MRFPIPMLQRLPIVALGALLVAVACNNEATGPSLTTDYAPEDRFGLPAIATVFISSTQKDAYNQAVPANDRATYKARIVSVLMSFGQSASAADALANALTPDIQPINTTQGTAFLNGRKLDDDVITAELGLIFGSNAALNDDHVNANDKAFLTSFPYLAAPFTQ